MTTRAKLLALATAISGFAPTSGCSWYFVRPLPVESAGVGYRDRTAMPPAPLWGTSQPQLYPQPPPSQ